MSASTMPRRKSTPLLLTQPSVQYRQDPYFCLKYDLAYIVVLATLITLMHWAGWTGFGMTWSVWLIPAFLVGCYVQMLCGVCIHNCSHINFPRPINRLVGELFGVVVMTRYASWEIIHRVHHKHSDHPERDPHPVKGYGFWTFVLKIMLLNLEPSLRQLYLETHGDSPRNHRIETLRSVISFVAGVTLFIAWYTLLGSVLFWAVFVPSLIVGVLHVSHFNWATHDATNPEGDFKPVNLDHGLFWLGNRLLFGLYYHANHHEYASLFNPRHLARHRAKKAAAKAARAADDTA